MDLKMAGHSLNVIDYQWLPHYKCIVNLSWQINFAMPNGENWLENGQWPTAILSSGGWQTALSLQYTSDHDVI